MDASPIKAAPGDLERELKSARDALYQIECEVTGTRHKVGFEDAEAALPWILNNIQETLLVVLEAAGLHETRQRLAEKWTYFEKKGGIGETTLRPQYGDLLSEPLEYIEHMVNSVRILAGDGLPPEASYELAKLEAILRKTPVLLRKRGVEPKDEKEIRDVMHDYLEAFFAEYKRAVNIAGVIRDFKPDGGVRNLKAAIEFKFADTQEEVSRVIAGVFEDISGYSGSLDWTQFYSVIYQTAAFESEDRIKRELTRAGTVRWTGLLVTGAGARPQKNRPAAAE